MYDSQTIFIQIEVDAEPIDTASRADTIDV